MKTKLIICLSYFLMAFSVRAEIVNVSHELKEWPSLALQNEIEVPEKDMIEFEEVDLDKLEKIAKLKNEPFIPLRKKRQFTELVTMANPDIKWRFFTTAFTSKRYSGFSQGVGGTTMLIENELFLDVEVEHVQLNSKDSKYYRHYEGDKYRVNTMLHWFPSEYFSLHLGFNGWVDK